MSSASYKEYFNSFMHKKKKKKIFNYNVFLFFSFQVCAQLQQEVIIPHRSEDKADINTHDKKTHSQDKSRIILEKLPKRHYINYDDEVILRDIQRYKHMIKKT